jgi:AcrR family transcriptional regulator
MPGHGSARARRPAAPQKARRDQLLDEAARQLNARGFSQSFLTEIAERLGLTRAALYYYVEDREDLLFQVYRRSCEIMARHLGGAARSQRPTLAVIELFLSRTLDPGEPELAAFSELGLLGAAERETVVGLYEGVVARLASVLQGGVEAGQIRPCDVRIVARTIVSIILWTPLGVRWATSVDRKAVIGAATELLAIGWAAERSGSIDPPLVDLSPLVRTADGFNREALFEARRESILATASRLFNRQGVDTTSLEAIGAALGATKRTLYQYVGDKQALISACDARADRIYSFIRDEAVAKGGSALDTLVATLRATAIAQQREDLEPLRAASAFGALSPQEQVIAAERSRKLRDSYEALFEAAQREGSMRAMDVRSLTVVIPGAGSWLTRCLWAADARRQSELACEVVDLLRLGLRPI